ncbi:hypothetical protein ACO0LF_19380 [Undibacterium sp. Di27W]|uniref:hypothetical protein n=1 Tax=Undibacterium sp. Di27W TaxID=3413036 RepID=UPI003BF1628A
MGLLDMFSGGNDDPQSQAQIAAAMTLLQAGGPSRIPVSLGQAVGGAMQSYQQTLQNAKDRQLQQNILRRRMAFENGKIPMSAMRDSISQLTNQPTSGLTSPNNLDPWRRALQGDPTKPFLSGRGYFTDLQYSVSDPGEIGTSDNADSPLFLR